MPFFSTSSQSIRWLFAELLVVVLGILLAFQIEEIRIQSGDRRLEKNLLENFRRDLKSDREQFEELIITLESNTETLMGYRQHLMSGVPRDMDLLLGVPSKMTTVTLVQNSPTYTGWRDSGRPDLISNTELRDSLFNYYGNYSVRLQRRMDRVESNYEEFSKLTFYDWDSVLVRDEKTNELVLNVFPIEPISAMPRHPEFYDSLDLYARTAVGGVRRLKRGVEFIDEIESQIFAHEKNL